MKSFPFFARQMLFLAPLYNAFHILFKQAVGIAHACIQCTKNHYRENLFLLTLTTFQVPGAENPSCQLQREHIMPRQEFFSSFQSDSSIETKLCTSFRTCPEGCQMIFYPLLSFLWCSWPFIMTDIIRFGFSFITFRKREKKKTRTAQTHTEKKSCITPTRYTRAIYLKTNKKNNSLMLCKYQMKLIISKA